MKFWISGGAVIEIPEASSYRSGGAGYFDIFDEDGDWIGCIKESELIAAVITNE